jgi:putative DNA primase/helicase
MKKITVSGEEIEVKAVPGFDVSEEGIYKSGEEKGPSSFLFGFLYVACTLIIDKLRYVLVRGMDSATGKLFECIFPRSELLIEYQDNLVKTLLNHGLVVNPNKARELKVYLANHPVFKVVFGYTSTGWVAIDKGRKAFVLPHQFIGLGEHEAVFMPEAPNPRQNALHIKGGLKEWQDNVAAIAKENPLLMFAIGAACASPLLEPLNLDGCGFHFYGGSSKGKTIILQVAASVFGNGTDPGRAAGSSLIGRWAATQNALEGVAVSFNHLPLLMDELGTSTIKNFDVAIYQLTTGTGKEAMNSNRELKKARNWRVVVLSSGEKSVSAEIYRTSGREAMTGHLDLAQQHRTRD